MVGPFGATFFGNLTLIGSTANVVALGMLEGQKHAYIQLLQWIKLGASFGSNFTDCHATVIFSNPAHTTIIILIQLQNK
jgi:Na+/H+ antiporter NhaD/arsenite permease-like protein